MQGPHGQKTIHHDFDDRVRQEGKQEGESPKDGENSVNNPC